MVILKFSIVHTFKSVSKKRKYVCVHPLETRLSYDISERGKYHSYVNKARSNSPSLTMTEYMICFYSNTQKCPASPLSAKMEETCAYDVKENTYRCDCNADYTGHECEYGETNWF